MPSNLGKTFEAIDRIKAAADSSDQPITPEYLRSIGFRLDHHHVDNQPHMTWVYGRDQQALEISRSVKQVPGELTNWSIWLRSDMAASRAKFVFLREVWNRGQLESLILAITDAPPERVEFDAEAFATAWIEEQADCRRRYTEYCQKGRWPHVPGR